MSIAYTPPNEIDGEPHEVALKSVEQLDNLAAQFGQALYDTEVQVRNARMTEALENFPDEAVDPHEVWLDTPDAGLIARIGGFHIRVQELLGELTAIQQIANED